VRKKDFKNPYDQWNKASPFLNALRTIWSIVTFATLGLVLSSCVALGNAWFTQVDTISDLATAKVRSLSDIYHYEYELIYYRIRLESYSKTRYISGVHGDLIQGYIYDHFSDLQSQWDYEGPWMEDPPIHPELKAFSKRYHYSNYWFQECCLSKAVMDDLDPSEFAELRKDLGYDENSNAYWMIRIDDRCGWPFRSFRTVTRLAPLAKAPPHYDQEIKWGIPKTNPKEVWNLYPPPGGGYLLIGRWNEWKVIPLRPIWTGVVLNALFWGAMLAGIRHGFRFSRRAIRRHRGLCPQCAYIIDEAGSGYCPECGTML